MICNRMKCPSLQFLTEYSPEFGCQFFVLFVCTSTKGKCFVVTISVLLVVAVKLYKSLKDKYLELNSKMIVYTRSPSDVNK